jgi:transposase-like protein
VKQSRRAPQTYLALGVHAKARVTYKVCGWSRPRARFWLRVVNDLKLRDVQDLLIAMADGPKAFHEAINAVFPRMAVQTRHPKSKRPRICGAFPIRSWRREGDSNPR